MRHTTPPSLFVLVFLALLFSASAQEDFTATANQAVSLCPCSGQGYYATITNSGTVQSSYTLSVNKEVGDWITLSPSSFSLAPKMSGKVSVYVNSPCAPQSTVPLTLFISTSNGLAKALSQQINFVPCYGFIITPGKATEITTQKALTVEPFNATYEACANGRIIIPLLVKNTDAVFDNSYTFSASTPDASLSVQQFPLKKGASGVLMLTYAPTSAGTRTITVEGRTSKGEVQAAKNLQVAVRDCYGLEVDIPLDTLELCGGIPSTHPFGVVNTGIFPANITLAADGADWATIDRPSFSLSPSKRLDGTLALAPPQDMDSTSTITVKASQANTPGATAQDSAVAVVHPFSRCYSGDAVLKENLLVTGESYIPVEIVNTGIRKGTFSWNISGAEWASLDETPAELNPGEGYHANIRLFPPADAPKGTYVFTLSISSEHSSATKSVRVDYQPESPIVKALKGWFYYYRFYLYAFAALLIILFLLRNRIISSWQRARKERMIREARIEALKKARKARMKLLKKSHRAERTEKNLDGGEPWLTGFRAVSLALVVLAALLGFAFAFFPTSTALFLQRYGTIGAVVLALGWLVVYLLKPRRKSKRK